MIRRAFALVLVVWLLGFALFTVLLPDPAGSGATDAVIVLTGGVGRIERGVTLLEHAQARRMLVSGVDRQVTSAALAKRTGAPLALFACCVDLGRESVDTRTNAQESADWLRAHHYRSLRLVTTDWHMPRALFELRRVIRHDGVTIVPDAVQSEPELQALFTEYNKYLLRRAAVLVGLP